MVFGEKTMKITFKIGLLLFAIIISLLAIFGLPPTFLQKGILITSVETNSTSFDSGLRQGQIITEIDGERINSLEEYAKIISEKNYGEEKIKTIIKTTNLEVILFSNHSPQITVSKIPKTNLKLGLDLVGGSRALIQAEGVDLSSSEVTDLANIIGNRLNVYGLSDIRIVPVSDLSGNNFLLIEMAGATPKEIKELVGKQGKFEAKIGNQTVFAGGDQDISSVGRSGQDAYIESPVQTSEGNYVSTFRFSVFLSPNAAKTHAEITETLSVNSTPQGNYLSEKLDLYLDDILVDSLLIGESLKGRVTTQISISGSGEGVDREEAYNSAKESMNKLQTILITGSLPYKLEIVKLDTISPILGDNFIKSILIAGLAAILAVSLIVFIRYKKIKSSLAIILTGISEVIIILGVAVGFGWNLDIPSIAGIIAGVGTGVDSEIIVLDESKQKTILSLKEKLKRAFRIILGSYFTSLVSLLPLWWAGAGLLKGFVFTTILGISIGVFITRPAFIEIIGQIEE